MTGLIYRAIGLIAAMLIGGLLAITIPDATTGTILAVVVGGGIGAFFFALADRATGRRPIPPPSDTDTPDHSSR